MTQRRKSPEEIAASDPTLIGRLFLVMHNVPFDVAFALTDSDVLTYGVIFGTLKGGEFDWSGMCWKSKD